MGTKKLLSLLLSLTLLLSFFPNTYAATTTTALSFTLDESTVIGTKTTENGSYNYLKNNWGFNDGSVTVLGSTAPVNAAFSVNIEQGFGGKSSEDKSLVLKADGAVSINAPQPWFGTELSSAISTTSSTTKMDFDLYLSDIKYNNALASNFIFHIIPVCNDASGNRSTAVKLSWRPYRTSGNIKAFGNSSTWVNNSVMTSALLNGWHKVSIVTTPVDSNSTNFSIYFDGVLADSQNVSNVSALLGLRIQPQFNEFVANQTVNAVIALDNICMRDGDDFTHIKSNSLFTIDSKNLLTPSSTNVTSEDIATAVGSSYLISTFRNNTALSSTDALRKGDVVTVTSAANANLYENFYISFPQLTPLYPLNFDNSGTDILASTSNYNYLTNSWEYNDSKLVSSSQAPTSTAHSVSFASGLGGRRSSDKALAISTTNFIRTANDATASPFMQWITRNYSFSNNIVFDFDILLNGNGSRYQVMTEYTYSQTKSGTTTNDLKTQVNLDITNGTTKFNNIALEKSLGFNDWHNVVIITNLNTKSIDLLIDGELALSTSVLPDTGDTTYKLTGLYREKFDSRYYDVTTGNGVFAIDNLLLYSGNYSGYKGLSSKNAAITIDNSKNTITFEEGLTASALENALTVPSGHELVFASEGVLNNNATVVVQHISEDNIYKTYTLNFLTPKGYASYPFEFDDTTLMSSTGTTTNGSPIKYNYLGNGWNFSNNGASVISNGASNFDPSHTVNIISGFGEKDSDDSALVLTTTNYKPSTGSDSPNIQYRKNTFDSFSGKICIDFDLYLSGKTYKNEMFFEYNYTNSNDETVTKVLYAAFYENGKLSFNGTNITSDFTYGKWHNVLMINDLYNQTVTFRIDGNGTAPISIAADGIKGYTGFKRLKFIQRFEGLSTEETASAVIAVDNFRTYAHKTTPYISLTSSDSGIMVKNFANKIITDKNKTLQDVLSALSTANGNTITNTNNTITVSNDLYSKTYDIIFTNDSIIYYTPVYTSDINDDENLTLTSKAIFNGEGTAAKMILAEYDENGLLDVELMTYDSVSKGDVLTVSKTVTSNNSNTYKVIVFSSFDTIKPLGVSYSFDFKPIVNVYLAGDSLMSAYDQGIYYPQQGWGEDIKNFFDPSAAKVYNVAQGGASTSSYYYQLFNDRILSRIKSGDYVFISFCHNDRYSTRTGIDADGNQYNYFTTEAEYAQYLQKYATEITAKGANLVFVTGPNTGRQMYQHENYPNIMKTVAQTNNIVCIDLYEIHNQYMLSYDNTLVAGDPVPETIKRQMFLYKLVEQGIITEEQQQNHLNTNIKTYGEDLTHFSATGSSMLAKWVAEALKNSTSDLKKYMK